jgi:RNA polymerase sigma-70 factor (ECF subfamily)
VAANLTVNPTLTMRLSRDLDGAFADVVSDFEGAVYTTALRISGGRPGEAEDLAAETFLRAYAALRRYPALRIAELQLRPWLITICLNVWRNQARTASRRPPPATLESDVTSTGESPEDRAERIEQTDRLAQVLLRLPAKQRIAVVLRHVVGLSYAEVAEVLACPESTAKSHVRRGLDQLRALATNDPEVFRA